jgi:hypothetical protein
MQNTVQHYVGSTAKLNLLTDNALLQSANPAAPPKLHKVLHLQQNFTFRSGPLQ